MKNIFILFFLIPVCGYSQYKISGKVENENHSSLENVEVILQALNSVSTYSELTNKKGEFIIDGAIKGVHLLTIKYFSENVYSHSIEIENDLDLKTITIISGISLKDVVIETKKPLIEKKVDRLIFNVENSVAATGGNALDALKLTPRIKVQNDKISMIGKGSILVMINDKLIQFSGEELANYLKTLNAGDLKKIEVISNPPAKYSAEGNSGLINIVTKKAKKDAWDASLRSTYIQATYPKENTGGSFNYQKGKLQLNSSLNYINGSNAPDQTHQIYYPSLISKKTNKRRDFSNIFSTKLGIEYKISSKISTGFNSNFTSNKPIVKEFGNTNFLNSTTKILDSINKTTSRKNQKRELNTLNYHFIYDIDTIGRKVSLDFDYFHYKNTTNRVIKTQSFFANNQPSPASLDEARNFGVQDIQNYVINLDMIHPNKWADLNYGGRLSFIETNNYFNYFDVENRIETLNPHFSNKFNYKENTQALYFSADKNISDKWKAKAGLRYEFTQTIGFSKTLNQNNVNNYVKLFPTIFLSFTPNGNHTFTANYGKRIQRPDYSFLNPFRNVSNPYSYSEGNPFLQPAFTNNFELEYAFKENLMTKIYYSHTYDNYDSVIILNATTNVEQIIPLNYMVNKTFGINQIFIFKLSKWWDVNTSIDAYYSNTKSKIPLTLQHLSGWNGEFSISSDFTLNHDKTLLFNTNIWFITHGVSDLDYSSSGILVNTTIKWLLLDKKLVLSLNLEDIINPKGIQYTSYSNGIKNSLINYEDEQCLKLSVIYNFGKKLNTLPRENKNQEEQDRAK